MYQRILQNQIEYWLGFEKNKVLILYGARQVGKTTLVRKVAQKLDSDYLYLDCEDSVYKGVLNSRSIEQLRLMIGNRKLLVIDEGQEVEHIGVTLKLIHDHFPNVRVIVTGSSSFELISKLSEPLTGRNIKLLLYPISLKELAGLENMFALSAKLPNILRFGLYPDVINLGEREAGRLLKNIARDYVFRDINKFVEIRRPSLFEDLLVTLAHSIGRTVTYNDIANKINSDRETVERYISILEKSFIIKRLRPLHRSHVREIMHPFKIYFYDLGIRNAIIEDFKPLSLRDGNEIGALWENFCIVERIKLNEYGDFKDEIKKYGIDKQYYFWRTKESSPKEYDLIEDYNGEFEVFEMKWSQKKESQVKKYPIFFETYPKSKLNVIHNENWWQFLV